MLTPCIPGFASKPQKNDEHVYDELKRLRKEVAKLKEERAILKKAAALRNTRFMQPLFYFGRESAGERLYFSSLLDQRHSGFRVAKYGSPI